MKNKDDDDAVIRTGYTGTGGNWPSFKNKPIGKLSYPRFLSPEAREARAARLQKALARQPKRRDQDA